MMDRVAMGFVIKRLLFHLFNLFLSLLLGISEMLVPAREIPATDLIENHL